MDARRFETAPIWLLSLAAFALALAWWVSKPPAESQRRVTLSTPERAPTKPLVWTALHLPPLSASAVAPSRSVEAPVFELASLPKLPTTDRLAVVSPSFADLSTTVERGTARRPMRRFVLMRPAAPLRKAGDYAHARMAALDGKPARLAVVFAADQRQVERVIAALSATADRFAQQRYGLAYTGPIAVTRAAARLDLRSRLAVANRWMIGRTRPAVASVRATLPTIAEYLAAGFDGGVYPRVAKIGVALDRLSLNRETAGWAWATAYRLRTLVATTPSESLASRATLGALQAAAEDAAALAEEAASPQAATELRRARYAIERRLTSWRAASGAAGAARAQLARRLEKVRWAMRDEAAPMTAIGGEEVATIRAAEQLAAELEAYEANPSGPRGKAIAAAVNRFAAAPTAESMRLAATLNENYRNANVRLAVSDELMRRLLPEPEPTRSAVRDRVAGAPVRGRSVTQTQLGLRLIPDPRAWRVGLEAQGVVASETVSDGGIAKLRSRGRTEFSARKLVVVGMEGVRTAPAVATAKSRSRLVGVRSQYDAIPLVGSYVRSSARDQYGLARRRASQQVKVRVERQVRTALDQRTAPAIGRWEQRFANDVVGRAAALGLDVTPIEMRTTDTRVITRLRLANDEQLASHTPRMRAPGDSLMSVQLHESAVNNTIEGLGLANARLTGDELRRQVRGRLQLAPAAEADLNGGDEPDALFWFAKEDPVRVRFLDGRVQLTLSINELVVGRRRHRAFRVHTFYRPEANGLRPSLVQDGTPQIEGRMRTASRLHLHGVLGKILGESRELRLAVGERPEVAERLEGFATQQFVIEDGWLGWALGEGPLSVAYRQVGTYVR